MRFHLQRFYITVSATTTYFFFFFRIFLHKDANLALESMRTGAAYASARDCLQSIHESALAQTTLRKSQQLQGKWPTYSFRLQVSVFDAVVDNQMFGPRYINAAVDDCQGDMYSLRSKFSGKGLGNSSLSELSSCHGAEKS